MVVGRCSSLNYTGALSIYCNHPVCSNVTLEYNYYVDLIISWKNRKEIVISMQKVRRMMY